VRIYEINKKSYAEHSPDSPCKDMSQADTFFTAMKYILNNAPEEILLFLSFHDNTD